MLMVGDKTIADRWRDFWIGEEAQFGVPPDQVKIDPAPDLVDAQARVRAIISKRVEQGRALLEALDSPLSTGAGESMRQNADALIAGLQDTDDGTFLSTLACLGRALAKR